MDDEKNVDNSNATKDNGQQIRVPATMSGIARIKSEFIDENPRLQQLSKPDSKAGDKRTSNTARQKTRGMDKNRQKKMSAAKHEVNQSSVRLCKSVVVPGAVCKFGDKCNSLHSKEKYWEQRPEDIGDRCVVFDLTGFCTYGVACRFANAHTEEDLSQKKKDADSNFQPVLNHHLHNLQHGMRKNHYDYSRADKIVKEMIVPANPDQKHEQPVGAIEREEPKLNMKSLKGKKYLAPLTTVGNLPFRRVCVDFGAEITCGEMALCTSLLQGHPSELSLVKRHPCEKIFGVQLVGGFPDTMTRATQLVVDECKIDFLDVNLGCPLDVINDKGGGCALSNRYNRLLDILKCVNAVSRDVPISVKMRYGIKEGERTAHRVMKKVAATGSAQLITLHPRSKEQRYTKLAEWDYVEECSKAIDGKCPFFVCGDVLNYEEYYDRLNNFPIDGLMIGRGALIKPWIFTEIDERRHWDISATERLDVIKKFVNYGIENWGSDSQGVENTRRFLLEWLSFQCRYIPVGLLEVLPQKMNQRPPFYHGRTDLETLLSSPASSDWVKITEMFLGSTPEGFLFAPKHNASAY